MGLFGVASEESNLHVLCEVIMLGLGGHIFSVLRGTLI